MDEIKWYESNSLESIKNIIKDNINTASRSFLAIGYYLKNVRDRKLYLEDGYQDLWEFAQAEFGISQSWASRYMSINDRFSKDGNSPMIQEKYNNFSSSKLSEMLSLTDEQLEQVTLTTTRAEIRDMKSYAHAHKTEPEEKPIIPMQVEPEISEQEKWSIRCGVLKEMCDSICYMGSYILEKNRYDMDTIRSLSDQPSSFGFGDDGSGHSKYDAVLKAGQYKVSEFNGTGSWVFESGEVDQQIWNFNGHDWCREHPVKETVEVKAVSQEPSGKCIHRPEYDCTLSESAKLATLNGENCSASCCWNCLKHGECGYECNSSTHRPIISEGVIEKGCTNCKYNVMPRDDYFKDYPDTDIFPCDNCDGNLNNWLPNTETVKLEIDSSVNQEAEIVEADVIQDEGIEQDCYKDEEVIQSDDDDETGNLGELSLAKEILRKKQGNLKDWIDATKDNLTSSDIRNIDKLKIEVAALASYICDLDSIENSIPEPVQPELPILKNNDQRKEWVENYKAWGEWYYDENIDCHYYKYDFPNGDRLIVEEYQDREVYWNAEKRDEKQYHLLRKEKQSYGGKHTYEEKYSHQTSSVSEIVEYLKEFQKKG